MDSVNALRNWEGTVSGHKYKTGQLVDYLGRRARLRRL